MEKIQIDPQIPCCVFCEDRLLLKQEKNGHTRLPLGYELPAKIANGQKVHNVLLPNGQLVQAVALDYEYGDEGWLVTGLRASYSQLSLPEYRAAGKARQILYWDAHSRFCPACGTQTVQQTDIMKRCPQCGFELYPPVSTAIIVLVQQGEDEILMVHARNFRGTFYGLVAGFVEAGETLEQCVAREVREETGLQIKNIRYFDSQPWPYPSGLMVGFTAEYAGGDIKLQDEELSAGAFYHRDRLPELPQPLSIARRLIEAWRKREI